MSIENPNLPHNKKQLLSQYDLHYRWFMNSLEGFSDEETNKRLDKKMNHIKYLAGHLMNSQYSFAMIAGIKVEKKWDELFSGLGKSKALDGYPYPSIEEIKNEAAVLYHKIKKGLEELPNEVLEKEYPGSLIAKSGIFDASIGDLWAFLNMHQAYHLGQIGILRKGFGKETMEYF